MPLKQFTRDHSRCPEVRLLRVGRAAQAAARRLRLLLHDRLAGQPAYRLLLRPPVRQVWRTAGGERVISAHLGSSRLISQAWPAVGGARPHRRVEGGLPAERDRGCDQGGLAAPLADDSAAAADERPDRFRLDSDVASGAGRLGDAQPRRPAGRPRWREIARDCPR